MNPVSIYFIGKKQGVGLRRFRLSKLENRRHLEIEGFQDAFQYIRQVRFIKNADIIWVRARPEHTTDYDRKVIDKHLTKFRGTVPIINDINIFDNYDCKEITFNIWKNKNFQCPDYITLSIDKLKNQFSETVDEVNQFIKKNNKIFLRTNNETAANGMIFLTKYSSQAEIINAIDKLIKRCEKFLPKRSSTRLMCVEYIEPQDNNIQEIFRVHVLFNKILSFYAVNSKNIVFHNIDMTEYDISNFIKINKKFCSLMPELEKQIIDSVNAIGCKIAAVEFFIKDNKPIMLEINPMWGGHASQHGFGNKMFQKYLKDNKNKLKKDIPNVYWFMKKRLYYKKLYKSISSHCINTTIS
tara:strand:- start:326 stop:1387 length:1062 start_codon:yes stop_codon:yes gene_type:complete